MKFAKVCVLHVVVCCSKESTIDEIEQYANGTYPTGIPSPWSVDEPVRQIACQDHPDTNLHYVLTC